MTLITYLLITVTLIVIVFYFLLFPFKGMLKKKTNSINNFKPEINKYTLNLIESANQNKLDPVIGREGEIKRVMQILSRRKKNNVILLGKAGIGKTAIAEGLAIAISQNKVPQTLKDKVVLKLDISAVLAGTKYRGEFENRFKTLIDNIIALDKKIILFIDEIHTIVQAGGAEGAIDADDIIKPPLARGELQVIGTTTINEFKQYIMPDVTLLRRFEALIVNEPTKDETVKILKGIKSKYEDYHQVIITDEIIKKIVHGSIILKNRTFPDKAIDIMDEVCAKVRLDEIDQKKTIKITQQDLDDVIKYIKKQII